MKHMMLDLETLGTVPGCVVLSIGAVEFDPSDGLGAEFHAAISVDDCGMDYGLTVDPLTEQWWERQSKEARDAAFGGSCVLREALAQFDAFYLGAETTCLWGHGASFDAPVLAAAYAAIGWKEPWAYNATRCTRTLYEAAGVDPKAPEFQVGTQHNALDDAKAQALAAIEAMRRLAGVAA
jgi:DNA polymerase III epsilon subunit-like protein